MIASQDIARSKAKSPRHRRGALKFIRNCANLIRRSFFSSNAGFVACAFGVAVAVNEFDDRHWRHVTVAEARFQNAHIAALTVFVAWAKDVEQVSRRTGLASAWLRPDDGRADRRACQA